MTRGLLKGLGALFNRLFPERQFYHRSHGEVHFVELSGRTQFVYVALTLGFLTWVGYASVNVVFKEQIISEKERDFVTMQQQYEQRIANLQARYDEVNSLLVNLEERFAESTDDLEKRHKRLKSLVENRQAYNDIFDKRKKIYLAKRPPEQPSGPGSNTVLMGVTELEPTQRRSRRIAISDDSPMQAVTMALGRMIKGRISHEPSRAALAARSMAVDNRVNKLKARQFNLLVELEEDSQARIERNKQILKHMELDPQMLERRFRDSAVAEGGPFIALSTTEKAVSATKEEPSDLDNNFNRITRRLTDKLESLAALEKALLTIPLVIPLDESFRYTSHFGARFDPFSRRRAFHSGMDMATRSGAPVYATAPGIVSFAGPKGPYGNLIEIDHGYGFKTRYGHLRKIMVKRGNKVDFYQKIATVGSTGRSTGPHLHYEIWFNNRARNPSKFFEAGKNVF